LASLVAEAALAVMPPNPKNFNVDNVRVVKIMGGSLSGSRVVRGMVFGREPEGESSLSKHPCYHDLNDVIRHGQKSDKSQSSGLHLWLGRRADRDERDSSVKKCGRNVEFHARRGEAHGKGAWTLI
jgi:hypothetical protein